MLLLVKVKNAAGLFWDSLDAQERAVVAYVAATLAMSAFEAYSRRSRERLKAELREELSNA